MRILHLVSTPLFSGPLPPTLTLALAQRAAGHQVCLAYDRLRGAINPYEEPAEPVLAEYDLAPPRRLELSAKSRPWGVLRDVRTLRALARQVDVLHVHMTHDHVLATYAAPTHGPVLIRTVHSERSLRARLGQRWLHRHAQGLIVRTAPHGRALSETFSVPPATIAVVPGSVDAQRFQPAAADQKRTARAALGLPQDALLLGHVALMNRRGQRELASSLGEAPAAHVVFVGRGERETELREHVRSLPWANRVHFVGYQAGADLVRTYHALDGAFCAQAGNDGSARAALEAMACGLPVVAVARDALDDLIDSRGGYRVASKAPEAIAEALRRWCADEKRSEKGKFSRDLVRRNRTPEAEATATIAFYSAILTRFR